MQRAPGRVLRVLFMVLALHCVAPVATAQPAGYPSKPVRAIVTLQPGAATDILARFVMDALSRASGKSFFVDNRPGAGGNIGMAIGEKSPPDGYTLQFSGLGSQIINPLVYALPGWDPKNFDGVVMVARIPFLMAVNKDLPVKSFADLVGYTKANPGKVNIALTSTTSRLSHELLKRVSEVDLFPIAYTSPNAAMVDAIAGRVSVVIETTSALTSQVESGKLRAIAITTLRESPLMPGLQSLAKQGAPRFGEFVGWTSLLVPHGTPREIVQWLNVEINKILAEPATRKRFAELGAEPGSGTPEELTAYFAGEREKWTPIIKAAGIKAD